AILGGLALYFQSVAKHAQNVAGQQRDKAFRAQRSLVTLVSHVSQIVWQHPNSIDDAGTLMLLALEAVPEPQSGAIGSYASEADVALFLGRERLQEVAVLAGHEKTVWSAAFSPNGERILTASTDATARTWNTKKRELISTLRGHQKRLNSAIFSPDGGRVAT